jgi:hypothetical protein
MRVAYEKPINFYVDNIGAIFLAGNCNSSERSKRIDLNYRYVQQMIDEGLIDIKFVRSKGNLADLFTKKNWVVQHMKSIRRNCWQDEIY